LEVLTTHFLPDTSSSWPQIANAADRAAALGVLKGVLTPGGNTYPTIVFVGAEQLQDADVLKIYSQIAKIGKRREQMQ
jgi:hypothetical protein